MPVLDKDIVEISENNNGIRFTMTYDQFIERYNDLDTENTLPVPLKQSDFVEQFNGYSQAFGIDVTVGLQYGLIANIGLYNPVEGISVTIENNSGKLCNIGWLITGGRMQTLSLSDKNAGWTRVHNMACFMFMLANDNLSWEDAHNIYLSALNNGNDTGNTYYFDDHLLYGIGYDQANDVYTINITPMTQEAYDNYF